MQLSEAVFIPVVAEWAAFGDEVFDHAVPLGTVAMTRVEVSAVVVADPTSADASVAIVRAPTT